MRGWLTTTSPGSGCSSATRASTAAGPSSSSPTCWPPARARSTASSAATRTSPWRCSPASARPSTPRSSRWAPGPTHLRVTGPTTLSGSIEVKSSKNAGVALLCASLLNRGRTTLRRVARIEEVNRLLEVLASMGVQTRWLNDAGDLEIVPPEELDLDRIDVEAARRTRSVIMFLGPLLHPQDTFELPYAGGCDLGTRTVEPHMAALRPFGLEVKATEGSYHATVNRAISPTRPIVLTERGDTVTENAILAAARHHGVTVIRNASPNYMVQDLCFFLEKLGVRIDGVGTTTLRGARHADHRRRRRLRPVRGPDRGDVAARRRDRHAVGDHHPPGADRVPRDRARAARGDGLPLRAERGVRRRQRAHPPGRHQHPRLRPPLPHRQDPPDAVPRPEHRQPAVLRGDRGGGRGPDAGSTTGSTRTGRST